MVMCEFLEIVTEIGPAPADPHHDAGAIFANKTNKELNGVDAARLNEMIESDACIGGSRGVAIRRGGADQTRWR